MYGGWPPPRGEYLPQYDGGGPPFQAAHVGYEQLFSGLILTPDGYQYHGPPAPHAGHGQLATRPPLGCLPLAPLHDVYHYSSTDYHHHGPLYPSPGPGSSMGPGPPGDEYWNGGIPLGHSLGITEGKEQTPPETPLPLKIRYYTQPNPDRSPSPSTSPDLGRAVSHEGQKTKLPDEKQDCTQALVKEGHALVNQLTDIVSQKSVSDEVKEEKKVPVVAKEEKKASAVVNEEPSKWKPVRLEVPFPETDVLEDISKERHEGTVLEAILKTPQKSKAMGQPPEVGRLLMTAAGEQKQLTFTAADIQTTATMLDGDKVKFNISTHRETKVERAVNLKIFPDAIDKSTEQRQTGVVVKIEEESGLIMCREYLSVSSKENPQLFFNMSEVMEGTKLELNQTVDFSVIPNETVEGGNQAVRIRQTETVFTSGAKPVAATKEKKKLTIKLTTASLTDQSKPDEDKPKPPAECDKQKAVVQTPRSQDTHPRRSKSSSPVTDMFGRHIPSRNIKRRRSSSRSSSRERDGRRRSTRDRAGRSRSRDRDGRSRSTRHRDGRRRSRHRDGRSRSRHRDGRSRSRDRDGRRRSTRSQKQRSSSREKDRRSKSTRSPSKEKDGSSKSMQSTEKDGSSKTTQSTEKDGSSKTTQSQSKEKDGSSKTTQSQSTEKDGSIPGDIVDEEIARKKRELEELNEMIACRKLMVATLPKGEMMDVGPTEMTCIDYDHGRIAVPFAGYQSNLLKCNEDSSGLRFPIKTGSSDRHQKHYKPPTLDHIQAFNSLEHRHSSYQTPQASPPNQPLPTQHRCHQTPPSQPPHNQTLPSQFSSRQIQHKQLPAPQTLTCQPPPSKTPKENHNLTTQIARFLNTLNKGVDASLISTAVKEAQDRISVIAEKTQELPQPYCELQTGDDKSRDHPRGYLSSRMDDWSRTGSSDSEHLQSIVPANLSSQEEFPAHQQETSEYEGFLDKDEEEALEQARLMQNLIKAEQATPISPTPSTSGYSHELPGMSGAPIQYGSHQRASTHHPTLLGSAAASVGHQSPVMYLQAGHPACATQEGHPSGLKLHYYEPPPMGPPPVSPYALHPLTGAPIAENSSEQGNTTQKTINQNLNALLTLLTPTSDISKQTATTATVSRLLKVIETVETETVQKEAPKPEVALLKQLPSEAPSRVLLGLQATAESKQASSGAEDDIKAKQKERVETKRKMMMIEKRDQMKDSARNEMQNNPPEKKRKEKMRRKTKIIWICGHTMVYEASKRANSCPEMGTQLGLDPRRAVVWWKGTQGMTWPQLLPQLLDLKIRWENPDMIIMHLGGNEAINNHANFLSSVKKDLTSMRSIFPQCLLVWSDILPRRVWRHSKSSHEGRLVRATINRTVHSLIAERGGTAVTHSNISCDSDAGFYRPDGVHLTEKGKDMFNSNLKDFLLKWDIEMDSCSQTDGVDEAHGPRTQPAPAAKTIWLIGDSYIQRGDKRSKKILGMSLGLDAEVWWFGRNILGWKCLMPFFKELLKRKKMVPDVLLIHCGGDNIGSDSSVDLVSMMKRDLQDLHERYPWMSITISLINERRKWRITDHPGKLDKARKFVNNVMATFIRELGGNSVEHPQIKYDNPDLFESDGCHLSIFGNDIFIENIFRSLEATIRSG